MKDILDLRRTSPDPRLLTRDEEGLISDGGVSLDTLSAESGLFRSGDSLEAVGILGESSRQSGFSMLELMIAIGIATILSTVLLAFTMTYVADVFRSRTVAEVAVESHFVLQAMVEDIRLADGIASTNAISDNNAPVGGWASSDANNMLVINSPAITSTNDIVYDSSTGYPYRNQLIYFVSSGSLYRRVLKNTSATGNIATTTCPESASSSSCPADKKYTSYIQDITLTFYDSENAVTTDPALARSLKVGISMSKKTYGKVITMNNSIQTTLRNY